MAQKWSSFLDSQPIQENEMSVKDYYLQYCVWKNKLEAVNYVSDEELYVGDFIWGLKKNLWVRMLRYKWIRRLTDALRRAEIEEIFLSWEENPVLIDEEEFEDEFRRDEDICDDKIGDLEVQIEAEAGKIVSQKADHKVFDKLYQPNFTATAYTMIAAELNVDRGLNFLEKTTSNHVLGNSDVEALNMLNKSTGLVIAGLNLYPEKLIPVEFVMVENAYQVFDKMPRLTSGWPYDELNGNKGSIPLNDHVPKVFDLGDGVETIPPFGWRFDEISKTLSIQIVSVPACFPIFHKMMSQISLEQTRGNDDEVTMTVYDPGGIISHDTFKFNKYSVFSNVGKTDSAGFDIHTTTYTSYSSHHDNNIVSEWESISTISLL